MSAEERAATIRANMREDMHTTVTTLNVMLSDELMEGLVSDGMFQIEHLLAEIEDLTNTVRAAETDPMARRTVALTNAREAVVAKAAASGFGAARGENVDVEDLLQVADWLVTGIMPATQIIQLPDNYARADESL